MNEFTHYNHGNRVNVDNCGACALENPVMIDGKMGINYYDIAIILREYAE